VPVPSRSPSFHAVIRMHRRFDFADPTRFAPTSFKPLTRIHDGEWETDVSTVSAIMGAGIKSKLYLAQTMLINQQRDARGTAANALDAVVGGFLELVAGVGAGVRGCWLMLGSA
jgi:hypothetical protein